VRNAYNNVAGNPLKIDHLGDLGVVGRIILELIFIYIGQFVIS
jgi:hypothetical protein